MSERELRALVDGYAVANDERDSAAFRALFTDDATLTVVQPDGAGHTYEGAAAIAEVPAKLGRFEHTLHLVSTHLAHVDGDRGTGVAYCEAHHHAGGNDRILFIRYDDEYVRTDDGWRFGARTVRIVWIEDR
jgi:ketosteroid isomerase-like protein